MKIADLITILLPSIVGVLYFITGCAYLYKKDYAWGCVWFGYAFSQCALVICGNQH